jgi:tetratricopeptide (TPR) repeat protein
MTLASIYGFENNKQVYPMDWWVGTQVENARSERAQYIQTEDYRIKKQKEDSLTNINTIIQSFNKKYGESEDIWSNELSYKFFNGKDYNDFTRESYDISIDVYGDGCLKLYSEKRNAEMMALIDSAITKNQGKRILVLTGAEHKYYFDRVLSQRQDVILVDFEKILPLKEIALSKNISDFIEMNLARGYYDIADVSSMETLLYHTALTPLLHGRNMDFKPDIIPVENIGKAQQILAEWEEYNPNSFALQFEKAWIKFLEKDYIIAVQISESIFDRLNEFAEDNPFRFLFWRNLAWCYDMTGEREKAIKMYQQCKQVCMEFGLNENIGKMIYGDFENEPYHREN